MAEVISTAKLTETQINQVVQTLRSGNVIAYPTDTIYGLGIDIFNSHAGDKLLSLKGRESHKPISVLYPSRQQVLTEFEHLNTYQKAVVKRLLPGPLTLILPLNNKQFPCLFTKEGYIGIRVIQHPVMNSILACFKGPLSSTSVNPAGHEPARSVAEIKAYFGEQLALILDAGPVESSQPPSTVIKVLEETYQILREGAVGATALNQRIGHL